MVCSSDVSVLSRIKELLPDTVDYWHIKMTIAILMVSTGFVRNATTPQLNSLTLSSPPSLVSCITIVYLKLVLYLCIIGHS